MGHYYVDADDGTETSLHPYHYEIKHITYPDRMFQSFPPIPPKSFEDTPFSWISTPSEFASMLDKLRCAKEIAVDLEHHNFRSWAGFLCLMQITTREEDFVVDALALRQEMQELNEVFTDPKIVKVCISVLDILFIADSDICPRYFMAQRVILSGYSKILIFTS
jgi:exosome complex exonuclease RRP6